MLNVAELVNAYQGYTLLHAIFLCFYFLLPSSPLLPC